MSQVTREINKITTTIIGISGKLIIYAVVILLLVEGVTRGYAFGHSVFYAEPMEEAPGRDITVTIEKDQSAAEITRMLKDLGLIANDLASLIQMKFYDYDVYPGTYTFNTSMTSKEILQILDEKPAEEEAEASKEQTAETPAQTAAKQESGSAEKQDPESAANQGSGSAADEPEVEIQINSRGFDGRAG